MFLQELFKYSPLEKCTRPLSRRVMWELTETTPGAHPLLVPFRKGLHRLRPVPHGALVLEAIEQNWDIRLCDQLFCLFY